MCKIFEDLVEKRAEERAEEKVEERVEEKKIEILLDAIQGLMTSMKWTAEQAMTAMNISDEDKTVLKARL